MKTHQVSWKSQMIQIHIQEIIKIKNLRKQFYIL